MNITDSQIKQYKKRFIFFVLTVTALILIFLLLMRKSFSSYRSEVNPEINSEVALYILKEGNFNININTQEILPRSEPYVYSFSLSNFDGNKRSDVNIEYTISLIATTNLPLQFELYRNENYNDLNATNIINGNTAVTDSDSTWYRKLTVSDKYNFSYTTNTTDTYNLVIYFPSEYSSTLMYEGLTDNIEVIINSKQVIE